jgi:hypothetical protein
MTNYIGEYIKQQRLNQKLTLGDVAVKLGYRNIQKGMNRVKMLEQTGRCAPGETDRDIEPRGRGYRAIAPANAGRIRGMAG